MSFLVLETSLNRAEFRWKWLRFLRQTALLGVVLSLAVLGLGGAILAGWVTSKPVALGLLSAVLVVGFIAWAVLTISIMAAAPARSWLASAVERIDRRLLDRLNTLLFLEKRPAEAPSESFAVRIAHQAQRLLDERPAPSPFPPRRALVYVLACVAAVAATVLFYRAYSPWETLRVAQARQPAPAAEPDKPFELALPPTNNLEQAVAWGEVHIIDPGADLKVTKVDVVPLQIEAAANQPLQRVDWFTAINGAPEVRHDLPLPAEPRYAVYKPVIYLDELQLADWDVLTYFAKASTDPTNAYASEVYFLEVRPFREDILKMFGDAGGEDGKAYQALNEISSLINRQQHVIRQTHQHLQNPPDQPNLRNQDRKKLADAEHDLSDSTRHLYAQMAAEMENMPIGEALDSLAQAQKSLSSAGDRLLNNALPQAQHDERSALSQLVAARKMFQKAVSDNPGAFAQPENDDSEPTPIADSAKKLSQIAEFRDAAKAAQDFVQKSLEQQKTLEQRARSAPRTELPRLGEQERALQKSLEDFQGQHPEVFQGTETESRQAGQALARAADALQRRGNDAQPATRQATRELERFNQALQGQAAGQQLADAYRLRQMLERQIQTFDQRAQPDSKVSDGQVQQTVEQARQTIAQLKKTAEQEPTRDAFGQPLRDALSGDNKVDLEAKLNRLDRARRLADVLDENSKQQRAGEARDALGKVGRAFDESQPQSRQMARQSDSLKPGEDDSLSQGMAELESLLQQLENHRPVSPEDQAKQGQQALANLQSGLRSLRGDNERGNQLLGRVREALKETPLDPGNLKQLLAELRQFSVETSDQLARKDDPPQLTNMDPSRLPPAYRGRIQKYFQKLSEQ